MDPYVLEMFMDNSTPLEEMGHISGLIIQNTLDISQLSSNHKRKSKVKKTSLEIAQRKNKSIIRMQLMNEFIHNCSDEEYKKRFLMTRTTMQALISHVTTRLEENSAILKFMKIPLDKKIPICVHLLTSTDSFREYAHKFGLYGSSMFYIFHKMCNVFAELSKDLIQWPSFEEQRQIKREITHQFGFPNCIGFIDSFTITVNLSKKPFPLRLQAVCDQNLLFRHVYCEPISSAEKTFLQSGLSKKLTKIVHHQDHLLGSSQYPLKINLMTPFSESVTQTKAVLRYNELHFKAWSCITKAFERLTSTFKRLTYSHMTSETSTVLLYAACFLHNFIIFDSLKNITRSNVCAEDTNILHIVDEIDASNKRQMISETIQVMLD